MILNNDYLLFYRYKFYKFVETKTKHNDKN